VYILTINTFFGSMHSTDCPELDSENTSINHCTLTLNHHLKINSTYSNADNVSTEEHLHTRDLHRMRNLFPLPSRSCKSIPAHSPSQRYLHSFLHSSSILFPILTLIPQQKMRGKCSSFPLGASTMQHIHSWSSQWKWIASIHQMMELPNHQWRVCFISEVNKTETCVKTDKMGQRDGNGYFHCSILTKTATTSAGCRPFSYHMHTHYSHIGI